MRRYLVGSEGAFADPAADGVVAQDFLLDDGQSIEEGLGFFAEEGVGLALDENNESMITQDMIAAVEAASAAIVSGELAVHDYMADESCDY